MKSKFLTALTCLVALLCISSYVFAAPNAVSVGSNGITFPDNSVQSIAAVLPTCTSGGVLVNNSGAWLCGSVLPIVNGIATCASTVCNVSACLTGFDNCDGNVANGCETPMTTALNCGGCGVVCAPNQVCSAGACQVDPNVSFVVTVSGAPAAGLINNQRPVVITANVVKAAGGPATVGTVVNFAITSGSGSLSAVSSTTNASGNASVTLNSTVEGSVTVTATAALATGNVIVPFTQPVLAIVKLATFGTLPVGIDIGGIQAIVNATPSAGLSILSADVATSGVGVGSLLTPNTTDVAAVNLALVNVAGMFIGEFATLNYHVAPGTLAGTGNFGVSTVFVIDATGKVIPGVTVIIQSVTIQ